MRTEKYLLMLVFIGLAYMNTYAQDKAQEENETFLKTVFSNVAPLDFVNLIPYQDKTGKWGYINKSSKNIVVAPFLDEPLFFHPGIEGVYNGNDFTFDQNGVLHFKYNYPETEEDYGIELAKDDVDEKVRPSNKGFKGFTVDSEGNLLTYSDLYQYNTQGIPSWNISIFQWRNKYYGIVKNKATRKSGIIDADGNPLKGFEFNYDEIINCHNKTIDKKDVWFFFRNKDEKNYSMVSTRGKKRLIGEMIDYPCYSSECLEYTVSMSDNVYSVFDHYNMKWIIAPQNKVQINRHVFFSSATKVNIDKVEDREKTNIYFLITDGSGTRFIDVNLKEYRAK